MLLQLSMMLKRITRNKNLTNVKFINWYQVETLEYLIDRPTLFSFHANSFSKNLMIKTKLGIRLEKDWDWIVQRVSLEFFMLLSERRALKQSKNLHETTSEVELFQRKKTRVRCCHRLFTSAPRIIQQKQCILVSNYTTCRSATISDSKRTLSGKMFNSAQHPPSAVSIIISF